MLGYENFYKICSPFFSFSIYLKQKKNRRSISDYFLYLEIGNLHKFIDLYMVSITTLFNKKLSKHYIKAP